MAFNQKKSTYSLVGADDLDGGNESDATACSVGSTGKMRTSRSETRFPSKSSPRLERYLTWLRWAVVIILQSAILIVLLLPKVDGECIFEVETGGDINGLYQTVSHKVTFLAPEMDVYMPNMTSDDNRMEIRRNWDALMPLGSGSVAIPDWKKHPMLGEPINDDPIRSGPLYEASWTHALHCLYYHVDTYHQLLVHGLTGNEDPYHAAHCFEYLRNSILCSADMTLEGQPSTMEAEREAGQPHVCRDRQEAIAWIEARRVDDLQDIVGP